MTQLQIFDLEADLAKLCRKYDLQVIAGFVTSQRSLEAFNGAFVVCPAAKKGRATEGFCNRVTNSIDAVMAKHLPLPDSIDY